MSSNNRVAIAADPYTSSDSITSTSEGSKKGLDVNIISRFNTKMAEYAYSDGDETGESYYYYGYIKDDGYWTIVRLSSDGISEARYSTGTSDYSTNWTNRASLSYQYFNEVF